MIYYYVTYYFIQEHKFYRIFNQTLGKKRRNSKNVAIVSVLTDYSQYSASVAVDE